MSRSQASILKDRERTRQWFADHPGYARAWQNSNKDKLKKYSKKGRRTRASKIKTYFKLVWDRDKKKEKVRWRLGKYGVTAEQFNSLLTKQNKSCAICENQFQADKEIQVDHCHKTKVVRGLLCGKCNRGLGMFLDRPEVVLKAYDYLIGEPE